MESVRMKLMVTHVLARVDILESTAKQVIYEKVFKVKVILSYVVTEDFFKVRNGITNLLSLRHASVKQDF